MLERCVRLDAAYTPAYLLLARLYQGQEGRGAAVGRLLRHVVRLQPNSPDHLAELASWLHEQGEEGYLYCCCRREFRPVWSLRVECYVSSCTILTELFVS
jgi:hypothetical protein